MNGGEEIANAFSELIDPRDQFERFKAQVKSKDEEERMSGKIDIDFLKALEYGMPPTGGEGIGIDRLAMIITNCSSITGRIKQTLFTSALLDYFCRDIALPYGPHD